MSGLSRDFTVSLYRKLLETFLGSGYRIVPFRTFIEETLLTLHSSPFTKILVLRHDIDKAPKKALEIARLENDLNIRSSYYFKIDHHVFKPEIILEIAGLNHEIGYHYEDLVMAKGDGHLAFQQFSHHLAKFREFVQVVTICAEGSPLSKYDNRNLWKDHDYRDLGLNGEPYLDIDYEKFLYLTDTGRTWNGTSSNVRDKVVSSFDYHDHSTEKILDDLKNNSLPAFIHLVTHPQRWHDSYVPWIREWAWQNVKNIAKRQIVRRKR